MGMGRRAAEALCPTALVLARDLAAETRRFEQVVLVLEGLIPRVEVVEPGLALVSVEGAVLYYGGEGPLVERVEKELSKVAGAWMRPDPGLRLGLADGPFAARWAAISAEQGPRVVDDTAAFLSTLDISTLEKDELIATFRWLGVSTLGELAGLPREAVASRFGYSRSPCPPVGKRGGSGCFSLARYLLIWRWKPSMTTPSKPLIRLPSPPGRYRFV